MPSKVTRRRTYSSTTRDEFTRRLMERIRAATPSPQPRQACEVCRKWPRITVAHHIWPVAPFAAFLQETGLSGWHESYWNIETTWLCPTHHAAVHDGMGNPKPCVAISAVPDVEELRRLEVLVYPIRIISVIEPMVRLALTMDVSSELASARQRFENTRSASDADVLSRLTQRYAEELSARGEEVTDRVAIEATRAHGYCIPDGFLLPSHYYLEALFERAQRR